MPTFAPARLALFVALASGCNSIIGIHDPVDGVPGTAQNDGGARTDVTAFVGPWLNTSGTIVLTCNGTSQTFTEMNTLTVTKGTSTDLLITSKTCALTANVTGDTATLVGHQPCVVTTPTERDTYDIATGSFVIEAPGVGKVTLAGTVKVETQTGTATCDFLQTDPYMKTAQ